jgi:hypothetical protein
METMTAASRGTPSILKRRPDWRAKLSCTLWGHHVDNHRFRRNTGDIRRCGCGTEYLLLDRDTRVRHTLSCFFGHHTYERLSSRDGHHEYVCVQCGHPLLFRAENDPYAGRASFGKKVRYRCGLFGHRQVHLVAARDGFREYACACGHTFLKTEAALTRITHPLVCVLAGHFVRFVSRRYGHGEYVCRNCGHPFCFAEATDR